MKFFSYGVLIALCAITSLKCKAISITESAGWLESAYVKFTLDGNYDGYNVYIQGGQYSNFTKIDDNLVRRYTNYGRADAVGLKAANYIFKIIPTKNRVEQSSAAVTSSSLTVKAHDRSGFAFKGNQTPGAYQNNGELKQNALVIYVTEKNKDNVKANITTNNKGASQECVGLLSILTSYKKGYETRPVCIRIIGNVTDMTGIDEDSNFKGDLMVSSNKKDCGGFTIEGIGNDAVANGWGIRFKGLNYGEIRNLGFMNCNSDEGDDVGLQQDNLYCWVHNCDMFYGDAGKDKDQVKGDGSLDCKKSNYITFSYNRFWDNGKCNLLGLSEGTNSYDSSPYYITYHHNWYDHSDSRHPRARYYNAHVYNNYYDGNSKYGAGACLAASVFMESNYFRNCTYPMMISMQGSDVYAGGTKRDTKNNPTFSNENGGMIKAFNNYMTGSYTFIPYNSNKYYLKGKEVSVGDINSSVDFDAYVVNNTSTQVPSSVVSVAGSNRYSNFDTDNNVMYSYSAQSPADAVTTIKGNYGAGRMQHGDFQYTFDNSADSDHDVDTNLKNLLTNYKNDDLIGILKDNASYNGGGNSNEEVTTPPAGETSMQGLKFWEWDGVGADAKITGALDNNFKTGSISGGALLWGDGSVIINHYTDLTGYNTLKIYGSNGVQLRALFNRQTQDDNAKDFIEKTATIENGVAVFELSDITPYVHLNAIKTEWGSPEGKVTLMTVIGESNNNNNGSGNTNEEVTTAPSGETSMLGLKFWEWDGVGANAAITGALDNNFNTGTIAGGALLWGDGNVIINHYTDLTGYNTLKIYGSNGVQLRALFNRQTQDDNAKDFIEKTATIENGVAVFELSDITPYVHLNAIKTEWGSPEGKVTLMTVIGEGNNNNSDSSFNSGEQGNENQGGNQANTINEATESNKIQAIYNANGVPSNALKSGINFIQMTDGTIKKVLVK